MPGPRVLALCGGVGGSKLALGLHRMVGTVRLTVGVNTGDDFELLGLHISPDLDTVLYTLAGLNDTVRGWGRANETWNFMAALDQVGGETWFSLGDRDLALHVERTHRMRAGETLSSVMGEIARRVGVKAELLPMSDQPIRTVVHTSEGTLPFQHYFVKHACAPVVTQITFEGADHATANPALIDALADPLLAAVVICPSNPYLSIDPILSVPGIRWALQRTAAPVVVVSPIVGGKAVKGPTAKIMVELGQDVSSATIARHYADLIDGIVIDESDAADVAELAIPVLSTRTLMSDAEDKYRLAREVLAFAESIAETVVEGTP